MKLENDPSPEFIQEFEKYYDKAKIQGTMSDLKKAITKLRDCVRCPFHNTGSLQCAHCVPRCKQETLTYIVDIFFKIVDRKKLPCYHWEKNKQIQQATKK